MIKLGSHVSFKKPGYLHAAITESIANGANCAMIYMGAPQSTMRANVQNYQLFEYLRDFKDIIKPEDIIVHAPYITNAASEEKFQFANNFLIQEIERMNYIGAKYLVLHPGAYTKFTKQSALNQLIKSIDYILENTKDVEIILETMAGKGTEIGTTYEDLIYVLDNVKSNRKGICLDTCHVWDAGYNLHNYDQFIEDLKDKRVLEYLKVIHLNDSKNALFSKKDRHENIGKGYIGVDILKRIVHDPLFDNIPIILETPWVDNKPIYKEEIKLLLDK
ncbi:deoxyribonuclease IV [Mycoplasma iguanae]|uniref:Probable endonuclease 4 n=1 Tax=Mycoplasma iguanae TaxID=292461 RepID=A0ABY5R8W3_9MOLU|nr:deoxyribonuclease IV [Mycoplasma iguanae]UVD81951.1 deoxyribonuclease IV [Mycoplasma iguanae]